MKTKNIVGTLIVTNIIAVLIILVVLIASLTFRTRGRRPPCSTGDPCYARR
ncbi:MAG: hypothetical protein ACYTBY_11770 [Planctomycetota bacterium]|jgi:hypothetical protein